MKNFIKQAASWLASLEIWLVGIVVLLSMVKTDLLPWAVLIAILFWPIRWIASGRPSQRTPADFGVALLILMIPVTLWATALPENTTPQVYRLALGNLVFLCHHQLDRPHKKTGLDRFGPHPGKCWFSGDRDHQCAMGHYKIAIHPSRSLPAF